MSLEDYHEQFASVYDLFYGDRDVDGEVRAAIELLEINGKRERGAHVLDFGCGTGSHVLAFARRGVSATGFDRSEAMIACAKKKHPPVDSAGVQFSSGSFDGFCDERNGHRFDGAVSFFNVMNCMELPSIMLTHLKLLRGQLSPGSRFLVDVWNGAAVFVDEPHPDVRHYPTGESSDEELVRITVPNLDRVNQICTLRYRVLRLDRAHGSYSEFESVHTLRFLTPVQYRHLFELADFSILDEFPAGHPGTPITDHDWYLSYLLRAER